jgi:putative SOS response-associated peptidase YedK
MESIHNRMPVMLPRAQETLWLDRAVEDPQVLLPLLAPYPAKAMAAYEVSTAVNSPKNDSPVCVEPLEKAD